MKQKLRRNLSVFFLIALLSTMFMVSVSAAEVCKAVSYSNWWRDDNKPYCMYADVTYDCEEIINGAVVDTYSYTAYSEQQYCN